MYPYNDMAFVFTAICLLTNTVTEWFYHNDCIFGKV
jgi:hypothetical protein